MAQRGVGNVVSTGSKARVAMIEDCLGATIAIGGQDLITSEVGIEGFIHPDHFVASEKVRQKFGHERQRLGRVALVQRQCGQTGPRFSSSAEPVTNGVKEGCRSFIGGGSGGVARSPRRSMAEQHQRPSLTGRTFRCLRHLPAVIGRRLRSALFSANVGQEGLEQQPLVLDNR